MEKLLHDIVLGALLHDIGKAIQRASPNPKAKRHQEFGVEWLRTLPKDVFDNLKPAHDFILRHHTLQPNDPKYEYLDVFAPGFRGDLAIVWEADNLSSGERYKEDPDEEGDEIKFDPSLPLYSIFNRISIGNTHSVRNYLAYPLQNLKSSTLIFPQSAKKHTSHTYETLLKEFNKQLNYITKTRDKVQFLLNLMECYFSLVPSETAFREEIPESLPDISLFDHAKMTAAIASALYGYFQDAKQKNPGQLNRDEIVDRSELRYLLVSGDFSGIQEFLYTITYRAALRGLRARSMYLELLSEHFVTNLLETLQLSRTQILFIGGGTFYLLLPNTQRVLDTLNQRKREFNEWLLHEHDGTLFLSLTWEVLNGKSFLPKENPHPYPKLREAWLHVRHKQDEEKRRKFHHLLTESFFVPYPEIGTPCGVCQKISKRVSEFTDETTGETYFLCPTCKSLETFGRRLPRAKFIEVYRSYPHEDAIKIEKRWYKLSETVSELGSLTITTRYAVNIFIHKDAPDAIPLLVGNYPEKNLEFETAAKSSIGSPYLATFRADVDNLGTIFSKGIPEKAWSISRMAMLSRMLSIFFRYGINSIAKGDIQEELRFIPTPERDRHLVIVYSGGDDLFVTGAWSDVVEFAFEVRRAFRKFVAENPDITLSGGIILASPKFPIYRMAQIAGDAEEQAKSVRKNGKEKNGLALFDLITTWEDWEKAIDQILIPLLKLGKFQEHRFHPKFPRSLIYKLLALANQTKGKTYEIAESEKWDKEILVLPRVLYVLGRSKPKFDSEEQNRAWEQFTGPAVSKNKEEAIKWLRTLPGPLTWLDYLMRGGEVP